MSENIVINPIALVDDYLQENTWRLRENANVFKSIGGLILHEAATVSSAYWLDRVYSKEVADAHKNADMHLHDLGMLCFSKEAKFVLADDREMSFEEAERNGITRCLIKAYDESRREVVVTEAVNICKRGLNKELVRITLADGSSLPPCEPTHRFLTKRGMVEAQYLTEEDDLVEV